MNNASERIQETLRTFHEQAQKAGELQSAMADLRGSAQSPDRLVNVTVAPSGAVLDLELSRAAMKLSASQLQQSIMAAIRAATEQAATQLNDTVAPILGDQFSQFQQAFNAEGAGITPGQGVPAGGSSAARQPRRPEPDIDDDDLSGESFLR